MWLLVVVTKLPYMSRPIQWIGKVTRITPMIMLGNASLPLHHPLHLAQKGRYEIKMVIVFQFHHPHPLHHVQLDK
jgi:hypothetical protein